MIRPPVQRLAATLLSVFLMIWGPAWSGEFSNAVVAREFVFTRGPFVQSHAATIAEAADGLVAAWYAGKREGADDVGIWVARHSVAGWSAPQLVATGHQADGAP
jgi:predicted neuraminidase